MQTTSKIILNSISRSYAKTEKIKTLLTDQLNPALLNIEDVSGGCGSMYRIEIISDKFKGKSVLNQHREVNQILKDIIPTLHGLTLYTKSNE
eukprot:gene2425-2995_t